MTDAASTGRAGGPRSPGRPEWFQAPEEDDRGLGFYVRTVRERIWIVLLVLAVTLAAAVVYLSIAEKVYEAEAELVITPAPSDAEFLVTLGLPTRSADPRREVQTAALLVTSHEVAERAQRQLNDVPEASGTPTGLLRRVSATPVAESNLVAISAEAADPDDAAAIASAFARSAIAERTARLMQRVDDALENLQVGPLDDESFNRQIAQLRALRAQNRDPTLDLASAAQAPTSPDRPRPRLTIAGALLAGLVLGLGGALSAQALDPRLRREQQLRRLYRLPILTRIPRESGRSRSGPLVPRSLSPPVAEAFRTLRGTLAASRRTRSEEARVVLVTGSSPSEGKTTTAINTATSLAAAGKRVILIEGDVRRPTIGPALGVSSNTGLVSVLLESVPLEDALVRVDATDAELSVLLADYEGDWISDLLALPVARRAIERTRSLADYVIIDSPPLVDVVDALPLIDYVDDVLITVRLGTTRIERLLRLGELLAENRVEPVGFAVIEASRARKSQYHYSARERRLLRPADADGNPSSGSGDRVDPGGVPSGER